MKSDKKVEVEKDDILETDEPLAPLPPGWHWGVLGDGLFHRKQSVTITDNVLYDRVRIQIHGRGIVHRDRVPGTEIKTKKQQLVRAADFLVAEIDAKVGGFGIVPDSLSGAIVSSHYFTFELLKDVLIPAYLNAFIVTGYITKKLQEHVRGSLNYAAIRPRHIQSIPFPFPKPEEQQRIGGKIQRALVIKESALEQLKAIEKLPESILIQSFQGGA